MAETTRDRILAAAADLLMADGPEALSTRAVAAAAGVQAPALYRLFGDKQGLLDAVASYGFERYLAQKKSAPATDDPVTDLRRGWDMHVEFGLTNPACYVLMYGMPRPGRRRPTGDAHEILVGLLDRVAAAGRLRVPVDHAANLVEAASVGVVLGLLATPVEDRDPDLSARAREAVLAAVTTDPAPMGDPGSPAAAALALDAALAATPEPLTTAEAALLREWLRRIATERP